jgi:general secretion pathway protein E
MAVRSRLEASVGADVAVERRGRGCEACARTGYRGRTGLYELLPMSESLSALVARNAPLARLRSAARGLGMRTLLDDGWAKVAAGATTMEEVLRVTRDYAME